MEPPNFSSGAADPRFTTEDPTLPDYRRADAECGEWPANHEGAVNRCGQLDASFAALLPLAKDSDLRTRTNSSIDQGLARPNTLLAIAITGSLTPSLHIANLLSHLGIACLR